MATKNESKSTVVTRAQQLGAGVAKHLAGVTQVTLTRRLVHAGGSDDQATAGRQRAGRRGRRQGAVKAKLATQATALAALRPLMGWLVAYVKLSTATSRTSSPTSGSTRRLARRPRSSDRRRRRSAKRASTRAARGTKGSVQKKAVKGDVTGITITPTTATK